MSTLRTPKLAPIAVAGMPGGRPPANARRGGMRLGQMIEAIEKGSRLAWTMAVDCPCLPLHGQTQRAASDCARCSGSAMRYVGPPNYTAPDEVGSFNKIQQAIIDKDGAAVIRGSIQRVSRTQDLYNTLGNWVASTMHLSVRPENKIGHWDRLVNLDAEMAHSQLIIAGDPTLPLALRYLATRVFVLISDTVRYEEGRDFKVDVGQIVWADGRGPAEGTRLGARYLMHPTWLVDNHPHVIREYHVSDGDPPSDDAMIGNPQALPLQAVIRLEFLPEAIVEEETT